MRAGKTLLIIGTRPEAIKMAPVALALVRRGLAMNSSLPASTPVSSPDTSDSARSRIATCTAWAMAIRSLTRFGSRPLFAQRCGTTSIS